MNSSLIAKIGAVLLAAGLASPAVFAEDGHVFLGGGLAHSNINVPQDLDGQDSDTEGMGVNVVVGYYFVNEVFAYAGAGSIGNFDLFAALDSYSLSFTEYGVGYAIKSNDFRLIPRIAYTDWQTTVREGAWFNAGDEEAIKEDDYGVSLALSMGMAFSDRWDGLLTYRKLLGNDSDQEVLSVDIVHHFK